MALAFRDAARGHSTAVAVETLQYWISRTADTEHNSLRILQAVQAHDIFHAEDIADAWLRDAAELYSYSQFKQAERSGHFE